MPRRALILTPLIAGLAIAALVLYAYTADNASHLRLTRSHVLHGLSDVKAELTRAVQEKTYLINSLKSAIRSHPDMDAAEFSRIVTELLRTTQDVHSIQLARDNVISHIHPQSESHHLQIDVASNGPALLRAMSNQAINTGKTQIAFPDLNNLDDSGTMLICSPVMLTAADHTSEYWGLLILHVNARSFLVGVGLSSNSHNIVAAINIPEYITKERIITVGDAQTLEMSPLFADTQVFDSVWQLAAVPRNGWTGSTHGRFILAGGALMVLFGPVALWIMLSAFLGRFEDRKKYRHLVQTAKAVILRIDMAGTIEFCNEYADEYFGYAPDELIGKPLIGTLLPQKDLDGRSMKRLLGKMLKDPAAHPVNETMSMRKNGEFVWVAWSNQPVLASDGTILGLLCVGTDITDRKLMEESIRQREKQYRLLAENVTDVIWGLDADLRYTYVSPSDESIRGFKRHEVLGLHIDEFLTPSSKETVRDALAFLKSRMSEQSIPPSATEDLEFTCADGSSVWLESKLGLMLNEDGNIIGIQGVSRDITDRKLAEALRDDMERMAKHDLKTPLGAVIGLPDEIRRLGPTNSDQEALLSTIENAGTAMLALINRSIDLYKMECGTFVLNREPVDVVDVIELIKAEAQPHIREKGISMGVDIAPGPFLISADTGLFTSMLSNLLLNAFQASPDSGTVFVTVTRDKDTFITIRNQGEVPTDMREIFFEKYATSNNATGSGLGTYSARLIARTHGGDIQLDTSVPGQTSVTVVLPE